MFLSRWNFPAISSRCFFPKKFPGVFFPFAPLGGKFNCVKARKCRVFLPAYRDRKKHCGPWKKKVAVPRQGFSITSAAKIQQTA